MSIKLKTTATDRLALIVGGQDNATRLIDRRVQVATSGNVFIEQDEALNCYRHWATPTCIIVDGPYGLGKFPGEPKTPANLAEWYAPHVAAWSANASTDTTLWFWRTEIGWALVHPVLEIHGWQYEECNIWDKGIAHVAGNCNSKTIRGTPVVTEVAVRYSKRNQLAGENGQMLSIKDWVRQEWRRSGLPNVQGKRGMRGGERCDTKVPDAMPPLVLPPT